MAVQTLGLVKHGTCHRTPPLNLQINMYAATACWPALRRNNRTLICATFLEASGVEAVKAKLNLVGVAVPTGESSTGFAEQNGPLVQSLSTTNSSEHSSASPGAGSRTTPKRVPTLHLAKVFADHLKHSRAYSVVRSFANEYAAAANNARSSLSIWRRDVVKAKREQSRFWFVWSPRRVKLALASPPV